MTQTLQTIQQQQTIADTLGSWTSALSFAQFDPALGDLLSINAGLAGDINATVSIENLEAAPATFGLTESGWLSVLGPNGAPLASVSPIAAAQVSLGAFDGSIDDLGNSGTTLAGLSNTATQDVVLLPATSGTDGYVGTGSLTLPIAGISRLWLAGPANMFVSAQASTGAAVSLDYNYGTPASDGGYGFGLGSAMMYLSGWGAGFLPFGAWANDLVTTTPQTLRFADRTSGWTDVVAAQRFDPTLGQLLDVNVTLVSDIQSNVAVENTDQAAGTISTAQTITVTLRVPGSDGTLSADASQSAWFNLAPYDGSLDFAGPSGGIDPNLTASSGERSGTFSGDLAAFVGDGTVDLPIASSSTATVNGPGNMQLGMLTQAGAVVTVSYTYQPLPVITGTSGPAVFTRGAVAAAPALTLADAGTSMLGGATVAITGGALAGDVLAANTAGTGISAQYDTASHTLTLTGADSIASYQQVLRSVTFGSTAGDPSQRGVDNGRTLSWSVTDDYDGAAVPVSSTVSIAPQPLAWTGPTSGNWTDGADWSSAPNAPGADQDVAITQAGSYAIEVGSLQHVHSLVLNAPGATLLLDASLDVTTGFTLEAGTLAFNGGTLSVGTFDLAGGLLTGGTVAIVSQGSIDVSAGSIIANVASLTSLGPIAILGTDQINTISVSSGSILSTNVTPVGTITGSVLTAASGSIYPGSVFTLSDTPAPATGTLIVTDPMQFAYPEPSADGLINPALLGFDPAQIATYDPSDSASSTTWQILPLDGLSDDASPACVLRNIISGNWVGVTMQQPGAYNSGVVVAGGSSDTLAAFLADTHASIG